MDFEGRNLTWWSIVFGLVVEFFFVRIITKANIWKSFFINLVMNGISTVLGVILIPVLGFIWEIFPGLLLYKLFNIGTYNPFTWGATFLFAVFANGFIEYEVIRWMFKMKIGKRGFWLLIGANAINVSLAFASIWFKPYVF